MMITTYSTGLKQAKAYRILQKNLTLTLDNFDLSMPEWALLGQVFDHKDGIQANKLADILDVEPPFVTRLINGLEKKNLLLRIEDVKSKRIKNITLTKKGHDLVPVIEKAMREKLKEILHGVNIPSLLIYIKVLEAIIRNDESN